jgi:O-antigen ligase
MLLARTSLGTPLRLEQRSMDDRARLILAAAEMVWDRPVSGVGGGAFVVRLYQVAGVNLPLEPVHNLPLLIVSELGVPGVAGLGLYGVGLAAHAWRRRQLAGTAEAWLGAALVGMLTIGLFDHYWWTMPPARMMLVTVLGLWVGWGVQNRATPAENRA